MADARAKLMRSALPGPSVAIACVLLAAPIATLAQSDSAILAELRECLDIASDDARLACLETRLTESRAEPRDEGRPRSARAVASEDARRDRELAAAPEPVANQRVAPSEATEPAERARSDTGRDRDASEAVTIVEVTTIRPGDARFFTEDGRMFAQTSVDTRLRFPEVPFEAVLEAGALGSVFLIYERRNRNVRVRVSQRE